MTDSEGEIRFKPLDQAGPGATAMTVSANKGLVILHFPHSVEWAALDPQTAVQVAEQMARAAHVVRFGREPRSNADVLADEIRAKATDTMRQHCINRTVLLLRQFQETKPSLEVQATHIVDHVLQRVT